MNRKKSKNLLTDLFVAASIGDAPGVDYFLRVQGLAVDASDGRGWKPIHHASLHGQAKVVEAGFHLKNTDTLFEHKLLLPWIQKLKFFNFI